MTTDINFTFSILQSFGYASMLFLAKLSPSFKLTNHWLWTYGVDKTIFKKTGYSKHLEELIFIHTSYQEEFDTRPYYNGIGEREVTHEPRLVRCWIILVIGSGYNVNYASLCLVSRHERQVAGWSQLQSWDRKIWVALSRVIICKSSCQGLHQLVLSIDLVSEVQTETYTS